MTSEERVALGDRGAVELLEELYAKRSTGVLDLYGEEDEERFYVVSGQFYLGPEHPAGAVLEEEGEEAWDVLVERLSGWTEGEYRFEEGIGHITSDVRGPLATASLIMDAAVRGLDDFQLLRRLGGEDRSFVALEPAGLGSEHPELDPQDAFLLSRMERPVVVKELLRQGDLDRHLGLQKLCRLLSVGLILPAELAATAESVPILTPELVERLAGRIEESLERRPLELAPEEHRTLLGELIERLGERTHYDLLEVDVSATPDEVYDAYVKLGRLVHPSHVEPLGLTGREAPMRFLFERATEAYLTLSDSERSRNYLAQVGSALGRPSSQPSREVRVVEEKEVAQRHYNTARAMAAREEFHFAIELLHLAVRTDPRPEYYALLGDCQAQNPKWLPKAISNYQRALQLAPGDPQLKVALAEALERSGHTGSAMRLYREAMEAAPSESRAIEGLQRLQSPRAKGRKGPSRLARWLERLRR